MSYSPYNLPFKHNVIGMLNVANHTYIAVERDAKYRPFCVYEEDVDGVNLSKGDYYETRSEAFLELHTRAMRWLT